jgi:hypothetical protein
MVVDQNNAIVWQESRDEKLRRLLLTLTYPVPSTRGMGPADRANRLHAEIERRIARADEILAVLQSDPKDAAPTLREIIAITEATHASQERAFTALSQIDCIARKGLRDA